MVIYAHGTAAGGCLMSLRNIVPSCWLKSSHVFLGRGKVLPGRSEDIGGRLRGLFCLPVQLMKSEPGSLELIKVMLSKGSSRLFPPADEERDDASGQIGLVVLGKSQAKSPFPVWIMLLSSTKSPNGYYGGFLRFCLVLFGFVFFAFTVDRINF